MKKIIFLLSLLVLLSSCGISNNTGVLTDNNTGVLTDNNTGVLTDNNTGNLIISLSDNKKIDYYKTVFDLSSEDIKNVYGNLIGIDEINNLKEYLFTRLSKKSKQIAWIFSI